MAKGQHVPKRVDPITGKRVPVPDKGVDLITPKPLPPQVTASETAKVAQEMADIRHKWAGLDTSERYGTLGSALIRRYRYLAVKFRNLTGQFPVPIHADQ